MYVEESGCFDPSTHEGVAEDVFSIQQHTYLVAAAALELEFQQLNLEMERCYNINVTHNNSIMQDQMIHDHQLNSNNHHHQGLSCDQSNWGEMNFPPYQNQEDNNNNNNFQQETFPTPMPEAPYLTTPDLPLPRCSQSSLLPPKSPKLLASLGLIDGKETKHFATERQRRMHLNDKYKTLKSMVPNPSKNDRASVVKDAIDYINKQKRGVNKLKLMVEKKRCSRDRIKRQRSEGGGGTTLDAKQMDEVEQSYNGNSLRSSWLQRRSNNTEVDIWIVDDKVTVKLVQQKRINCLLFASKVLDDLQLDLHHVAGGLIGDYYSFLFNSKISEGSTVYASAIAKKLIEVVDIQYAAIAPTNSY